MNLHIDSSVTTSIPFLKQWPLNLKLCVKGKWALWRHRSVCFILQLVPRQPVALIGVLLIQKSLDEPTRFVRRCEAVRSSALWMHFCMSVWWQMQTAFHLRSQRKSVYGDSSTCLSYSQSLTLFNKPLKSVLYCALVIQSYVNMLSFLFSRYCINTVDLWIDFFYGCFYIFLYREKNYGKSKCKNAGMIFAGQLDVIRL